MPVEFLSDAEAAAYGRFDGAPSRVELDRVFFLDGADRELIDKRRGAPNRLGFALQLTTVRWLGAFLPDPTDVPVGVLGYVARQLEIGDPSCVAGYLDRRRTRFEHAEEIKAAEGLRACRRTTSAFCAALSQDSTPSAQLQTAKLFIYRPLEISPRSVTSSSSGSRRGRT